MVLSTMVKYTAPKYHGINGMVFCTMVFWGGIFYHGPKYHGKIYFTVVFSTMVKYTAPKYHGINTVVLIPWYFGVINFTMVLMVNIPLQNTMILYLVNHSILGGAFYNGSVLLPFLWYRN